MGMGIYDFSLAVKITTYLVNAMEE